MTRLPSCSALRICSALALATLASATFPAARARACDTAATATPESTCIVLPQQGKQGVWFELRVADEFRRLKLAEPEWKLQISALERRAAERDLQIKDYNEVIRLKDDALNTAKAAMDSFVAEVRSAREEAKEARAERDAWFRAPWFWFGAGVVVTVATTVTIATTL